MHFDWHTIGTVIWTLLGALGLFVLHLALQTLQDALAILRGMMDEADNNPTDAPDEPAEKVLPPSNPPPPTPEQSIEGVLKAIRDQKATTTTSIPVICYSGSALTNLQAAVAECNALRDMLQQRIDASIV